MRPYAAGTLAFGAQFLFTPAAFGNDGNFLGAQVGSIFILMYYLEITRELPNFDFEIPVTPLPDEILDVIDYDNLNLNLTKEAIKKDEEAVINQQTTNVQDNPNSTIDNNEPNTKDNDTATEDKSLAETESFLVDSFNTEWLFTLPEFLDSSLEGAINKIEQNPLALAQLVHDLENAKSIEDVIQAVGAAAFTTGASITWGFGVGGISLVRLFHEDIEKQKNHLLICCSFLLLLFR